MYCNIMQRRANASLLGTMQPLQQEGKSGNLGKEIIVLKLINSYPLFTVINHISHMTQCVISSCPTAQQLSQQKYPIRNLHQL